ncbi:MAG: hypothetical protein NC907_01380 [Candidatus Omnitrophica bacterium]|nr:hypothetical protein [Candidatus Omnitrophota bacterium]
MKLRKKIFIPNFERPIRIPSRIKIKAAQPEIAIAGEKITLRLKFLISKKIKQEELLKLQIFGGRNNKWIFSNLHTTDPEKDGYVFAKTSSGNPLKIQCLDKNYGTFIITPGAEGIKTGEHIFITIHNAQCPSGRYLNKFLDFYKGDLNSAEKVHKRKCL